MSESIVGRDALPVNMPMPDAVLVEAHRQIVGLDTIGLAELILRESAALTDPRLAIVRLGAVELAARSAGVRR
jgi:hypothetical protein